METCVEFEGIGEQGDVDILSRPKRPSLLAQQWERHCMERALFIVCDPTTLGMNSPAAQDDQQESVGNRVNTIMLSTSCTDSPRFQPEDSTCTSSVCINSPPAEDCSKSKMPPTRVTSTPLFNTNGVSPNFSAESIYEAEFFDGSPLTNYSELSEQLAQQTEKVRQLELRLSECERNNANLSSENERLYNSLERAKKNEDEFSRSAVQSEQEALEARRERDELQESLLMNEDALASTRVLMRQLQDELDTVKRELQESEAKVQEMGDKLDEAHKQVVAAQTLAETLRQEVETHKKTGDGQNVQLEFTVEQLNEFKRINLDLSSELDYMSEEYRRVSSVNDNLKRQLSIFAAPTTTSFNMNDSSDSLLTDSAMISLEPPSLGEEIQALKDRGALPIGVETSDAKRNSIIDFVLQMMEERYSMAERQVRELAPRFELDPRAFAENENRRQIVINHIAAAQVVEEKLSEILQKLVASDVPDTGDESHCDDETSCIVVLKLVNMQSELRRATESLSERMGGLELQLTQSAEPTCNGDGAAVAVPSVTPGPGSSVADGSQQHGDGERACSEASWGRSTVGGGSGVNALHPAPLRDVSIEGSDAVSCAGSQLERDTCTHVTPERIKCQVHRELAALQSQINKSLEVLAALARSSDLLSVLKEYPISEQNQPDAVSATSGMEEHRGTDGSATTTDGLHPTSGMGATGHQLAKSCPTLATQLSAATQTENEQIDIPPQRMVGSTGDVKEFDEPSPKRFRSSSFVAAIEAGDTPVVPEEPEDGEEELEDEVLQVEVTTLSSEFVDTVAEFDNSHELLDEFSARVVEEHPCSDGVAPTLPASPEHPEEEAQKSSSPPNGEASPESERHSTSQQNPRLSRQRGSLTGAISSAIQRSAAVDLDENDETTPSAQQAAVVVSPGGSKRGSVVAFPSIPDAVLRQMGLHRDSDDSPESLTEHDVENKFTQLSLAFKTDKLTLDHRVSIQQRQRDDAERNVSREINELRNKVNRLKRLCQESETIEELSEVQHQVDVLAQSTESVSRSAELYGAVQQEERVSRAVDVILAHVENLRRVQSKERNELDETRRLLQEATTDCTVDDLTSGRGGVRLRTQQLQDSSRVRQPVRALQESSVRRTSFGSQSQRPESMSGSIDEPVRMRRSDLTLEAQLMQSEVDQSSEGSVTGAVTGVNHLDSLLHDEDVALAAGLADHLDLSCSEDELQHELNWRDSELRQRRSQSGQGTGVSQSAGKLPTARSLSFAVRSSWRWVRSLRWPWSTEQSIWMLRRGATAVLLTLAALTILFVLLPVSTAVATGSRVCSWKPLRIEMPSGYGFQGQRQPPPV